MCVCVCPKISLEEEDFVCVCVSEDSLEEEDFVCVSVCVCPKTVWRRKILCVCLW